MKRSIGIFLIVFLFWTAAQAQTVSVLCSPDLAWCEQLGPAYKAATGNELEFVRLSSSEALARLRAEAANPTFDVWFGGTGDPHLVAFNEGITEFYKPSTWDDLLPSLTTAVGETYIPLYTGAIGFVVNEDLLAAEGVPVPNCWTDLLDPAYKDLLAMPGNGRILYVTYTPRLKRAAQHAALGVLLLDQHQHCVLQRGFGNRHGARERMQNTDLDCILRHCSASHRRCGQQSRRRG